MGFETDHITITDCTFEPEVELALFRRSSQAAGAGGVVSFTGLVRGDADVLTLSHYAGFTEAQIARIGKQAAKRWPLLAYRVIHRIGAMTPGEPIVFVAAASPHRRAAFEAVDFMMDYLKSEAPFWKQEERAGETHWIEPRREDADDLKRWND